MAENGSAAELKLEWKANGRSGNGTLTARLNGDAFVDVLNITRAKTREDHADAIGNRWPAFKTQERRQMVIAELERFAIAEAEKADKPRGDNGQETDTPEAAALLAAMPEDIRSEAEAMLADPNLLKRVIDDVSASGVAGERELIATIYLVGTSRLLTRPLAAIVQGPSSSGKSYLIEKTAALFPSEAVIHATSMTPQALYYMPPGSLRHRFLVTGERSHAQDDDTAEATRALREMLSTSKLSKPLTVKNPLTGRFETQTIEQDGPIAYIESTTMAKVFDEDANRCIMLHTDERPQQTQRIITTLAEGYSHAGTEADTEGIIEQHHALQRMLERRPVVIPYADRIGELFACDCVQARRAFPQMMSMIEAITLLHQKQRATDAAGRLIATPDDYQLARHLLAKPMARLLSGKLSDPARRFYERLREWFAIGDVFTTRDAAKKETAAGGRAVSGWINDLYEAGLVDLVEASRGRIPAKWKLSQESPDAIGRDCSALPAMEAVFPDGKFQHSNNSQAVCGSEVTPEDA